MESDIYERLIKKTGSITVIGLGYVGLPVALAFAAKFKVIGFDTNEERINLLRNNIDPSREIAAAEFEGKEILFTSDIKELEHSSFYIIIILFSYLPINNSWSLSRL